MSLGPSRLMPGPARLTLGLFLTSLFTLVKQKICHCAVRPPSHPLRGELILRDRHSPRAFQQSALGRVPPDGPAAAPLDRVVPPSYEACESWFLLPAPAIRPSGRRRSRWRRGQNPKCCARPERCWYPSPLRILPVKGESLRSATCV